MAEQKNKDQNVSAEERPVPSQAEGDLETIEEDLEIQSKKQKAEPRR